jgi:Arc/MetJ-type ribon-helix-helix transcriptional regulator
VSDQRGDDGWGVETEYSIDEFYCEATDGRGHSDNHRVRLKPQISGEIGALVESGRIPEYSTSSAFIRDAIVHRLRWLSENLDDPRLAARLAEGVRRTVIEEQTQRYITLVDSFEEMIARTREVCERALRFHDYLGVAGFLDEVQEFALNSRDPYQSRLLDVVKHYRSQLDLSELAPTVPLDGGVGLEQEGTSTP